MRTRILTAVRWLLLVWGGLSLVGVAGLGVFLLYETGPGNRSKDNQATPKDVRFVLNWCGLGDNCIEKILHSHVSGRSFTGDYLDAYAIRISHVEMAELTKIAPGENRRWYRGDQLPKVLDSAVAFMGSWLHGNEAAWFPTESELRSADVYIYPWTIYCHGVEPSAAELIFVRPADRMVFFFGAKE